MAQIEIIRGDITQLTVDAIVNAANPSLLGGGGVDGAIHAAAGPELLAACRALPCAQGVRCPTGEARITDAFDLPARFVIHTVGPVWHGGDKQEQQLLQACYHNALSLAEQQGCASIAFPAISCGVYGYPIGLAAQDSVAAIAAFPRQQLQRILLVAFNTEIERSWQQALVPLQR